MESGYPPPVAAILMSGAALVNMSVNDEIQAPASTTLIDKLISYTDFEIYQDVYRCIPFSEKWFVAFRNRHDKDEVFDPSDDGNCAHILTDIDFVDQKINISVVDTYGRKELMFELVTYEDRTKATGFKVTNAAEPDWEKMMRVLYADCQHCIIFNLEYMGPYACNMLVPQSEAASSNIAGHCEHIYNMVCGTDKKWIYKCCEKKTFLYQYL